MSINELLSAISAGGTPAYGGPEATAVSIGGTTKGSASGSGGGGQATVGSGGALAIAVGDQVNMLENSVYSVISPEGCASILWRSAAKAEVAAEALKITARDLKEFGIIDEIVPEPEGGAHLDPDASAASLGSVLSDSLRDLSRLPVSELLDRRYEKFRRMGQFFEAARN